MQKLVLVLALTVTFWGVATAYSVFVHWVKPPADPWQRTVQGLERSFKKVEKRLTVELAARRALLKYWRKEDGHE
ncbi:MULTISPECIES: hypothetical protein [Carboxydocella]|uniref:Uncharacterized protein n=2 Tax=Carboxydocella TaxID=178898 RepID=A0A1T4RUU4_9FIRM|nr:MULTISPECIES: hypothetical protein [Carboxydocella]AVX19994.1 hypothetical protein CFE_0796 [Carboxydocella thermautotrophica]AVX30410.1 hypothetical protein CTH_0810 [Carboxydocella thermautotrophica]SKA19749.1 hypothetical protein SAMN02745885_02286 [Carboxydocella sporoproducens DSM 16521]GAW28047.1 hypothetical protein ULO1_06170 [Carboxydocella sp. ULO1]GAW31710.1 hypothetical protein JDF658_14750 [Carboxydocella sp. JDF658]